MLMLLALLLPLMAMMPLLLIQMLAANAVLIFNVLTVGNFSGVSLAAHLAAKLGWFSNNLLDDNVSCAIVVVVKDVCKKNKLLFVDLCLFC